ncbi:MAG TPA: YeaH/YhbH family protein [Cytophagaceae bacterium]
MAIFRDFSNQKRDRSAGDINRHKELVKKNLQQGIADIIAEEAIIGKSKSKTIKVPIKGIKEYRFIFGKNQKGVAQGTGNEQKGQVLQEGQQGQGQPGSGEAGNQAGEDIYETEITIEEAINLMFDDLELPKLERKKFLEVEVETNRRLLGYRKKGIRIRLSKRKTLINRLKRKNAVKDTLEEGESFPFNNNDLVYKKTVKDITHQSNAVVFCIMDTSGSMDQVKKYLARSFYFLLYQFIQTRYRNTEIVFIAHHTEAKEVSEDDFFHKVESGGTYISSGYKKALEVIEERYNPSLWNIYAFHCSDGDNFSEDNKAAVETAQQLCDLCNLFGYGEIKPDTGFSWSGMIDEFKKIQSDNFISLQIRGKEDVWPAFKKFLTFDKAQFQ